MKRAQIQSGGCQYRAAVGLELPEGDSRVIRFIASNEEKDRYGDIVRASGWVLDNFKNNPVLLFGHQSRELPIGRVTSIGVEGTQLIADAEFMPASMNEKAESVFQMLKARFLNAVSVGFKPLMRPNQIKDPTTNEWTGGYEFIKQELLELSVVPVPALAGALAVSRSFAGSVDEYYRQLEGLDDGASAALHAFHLRELETMRLRFA
jgi:HK97 family phage prohead protease